MPRTNAKLMRLKAKDQDRLVRTGVRASRHVMRAIQAAAIGAFAQDGVFRADAIVAPRMDVISNLATDSLVASFLTGYWRGRATAHQRRGVPMPAAPVAFSAYTETIKHYQTRAGYTDEQLAQLEAQYRGVATGMIDGASAQVSRALDGILKDVRERDLNKRDALKLFKREVQSNGLTKLSSSTIETMYRTQTAMAYSVGQQRSNADPDIDSILWGYEYFTVGDDRVRPAHAAMDQVRAPKGDPLWDTWTPPSGWNCRCTLVEIFDGDKLTTPNPPPETTTDPESGKTIPVQPDKGWAFNPAKVGPAPPSPGAPPLPIPEPPIPAGFKKYTSETVSKIKIVEPKGLPKVKETPIGKWARTISDDEQFAFDRWQGSSFDVMREAQMTGKGKASVLQAVKNLDAALDRAPKYLKSTWRGLHNVTTADLKKLSTAETFSPKALSSTSKSRKIAEGFLSPQDGPKGKSVMLEFRSNRTAVDVTPIIGLAEQEVIIRKGAQYRRIETVRETIKIDGAPTDILRIVFEEI